MRCLYCDKKLSLLKLAKGDSFCSPEHFDLHQLQLSKNAFQRLMTAPTEETHKEPLVLKPREEPQEALAVFEENEAEEAAWQAPESEVQAPPYAPFATWPIQDPAPNPPGAIASGLDENEPFNLLRDLALPIHDVNATVCILNLYLRLSLDETPPLDSPRIADPVAGPEDFSAAASRPALGLSLDSPQLEQAPESKPVTVPLEIAAQPAVIAPLEVAAPQVVVEPVRPPESRLPFLVAPSFRERTVNFIALDGATTSVAKRPKLAPVLDPGAPTRPDLPVVPKSHRFARTRPVRAQDFSGRAIESACALPEAPAFFLPTPKDDRGRLGWHISHDLVGIARPALETTWESTRARDFDPPQPGSLLVRPEAGGVERIDPGRISAEARTVGSLFLGVLETRPPGKEPVFADLAIRALKSALPEILAPFPAPEPFSSATWENQAPHFSLPASIADGMALAVFPLQPCEYTPGCIKQDPSRLAPRSLASLPYRRVMWRHNDSAIPPTACPRPAVVQPEVQRSVAQVVSNHAELVTSTVMRSVFERGFAAAANVLIAQSDLPYGAAARLPGVADTPVRKSSIGLCNLDVRWEQKASAAQDAVAARFLPFRGGPTLPSAKSWPRLGPVNL